MEDDKVKPFRITFWRPSRWERALLDIEEGGPADVSRFLEEAYTWEPAESIWDSLVKADTDRMRELLVEGFSPDKPLEKREIRSFRSVLEEIERIVADGRAEWKDCQQTDESGDVNLRANLLLSFLHHLTWICNVFADVPGISITVH